MKMELCHTYCTLYSTILLDVLLRVYKQNYVKMRTINTKLLWFRLFRGVYVYADQPLNNIGEKIKILSMDTQSTTSGLCHIKKKMDLSSERQSTNFGSYHTNLYYNVEHVVNVSMGKIK